MTKQRPQSPNGQQSPNTQQNKWDLRYLAAQAPNPAAAVLRENRHLLPSEGRALELACGLGGNSLLLAAAGLQVDAVDLSPVAITKLRGFAEARDLRVNAEVRDLEKEGLPAQQYAVICVSAFLDRGLCASISQALAPGGLLFYQTFTRERVAGDADTGGGPSNPRFLLEPGELLALFGELQVVAYREERDCGDLSRGLRNQAYLVAQRAVL